MTIAQSSLASAQAVAGGELAHLPQERRVPLFALTCLIFFTTCGGAYGLEPLIGAVGPAWSIGLILATPLLWSLPTALMAAELTSLMPEEGGYYVWTRKTFGSFWAVQHACWSMTCSIAWLAIYPVLFVGYLSFFIPALSPTASTDHLVHGSAVQGWAVRWLISVLVIVLGMALNLRGARKVGQSSEVSTYLVLGAFVVMLLVWLKGGPAPSTAIDAIRSDLASNHKGALLLGLSVIVFDCSGWENASTYAGEVDQPQRNYPRALLLALLMLVLCYVLPVLAGISATTSPDIWSADAGWPVIARLIGGRWLGGLIAAAGLVSVCGLYNAQLLYSSRLPYVLACDGWLPIALAKVAPGMAVPRTAIYYFSAITAIFAALPFGSLAVIQCLLYTGCLTLEFLTLIVLRFRRPDAHRSFRVPGGRLGMAYVCVAPFAFGVLLVFATLRDWRSYPGQLMVIGGVAAVGVVLYLTRRKTAESSGGLQPVS